MKDYKIKDGLSSRISNDIVPASNPDYIIKGPMGKGIDLKPSGVHIAFSAGTGVLPFLDLVAFLIRHNLGQASPELSNGKKIDD